MSSPPRREFAKNTGIFATAGQFLRELKDVVRFLVDQKEGAGTLCFYSERDIYYRYFEGYIDYVLSASDLEICYITSDPGDPVLDANHPRIKAFYINHLLAATLRRLNARALVMTMPDLDRLHVKRSRHPVKYVYLFHGVGSIHLQYDKKAFDAYDTIFCLGPYDRDELRRAEELYDLPAKELVESGYYWIEKIFRDHSKYRAGDGVRRILVAPSWHDENILALCLTDLLAAFESSDYHVTLRPHPETIKRNWPLIASIQKRIEGRENLALELDMVSGLSIHQADLLITDWSAISFEYAFGTERPVLFIDTPCKIQNPDYAELGIEPAEFSTRAELGRALAPGELGGLVSTVDELIEERELYREKIVRCREQTLFNWLSSDRVGGEHLIHLCGALPGEHMTSVGVRG